MKILHVVRQFHPAVGGLEKYVYSLSEFMTTSGLDVTVLTLNKNFVDNSKLPDFEILPNGIKVIRIPFYFSKKYPIAPSAYKHLKGYDVINVHALDFFADYIVLSKYLHKTRIILVTHGGFFHTKWGKALKIIYFNTITRLMLKYYDKVIGCSVNDMSLFNKITTNISLIENGVDTKPYINKAKSKKKGKLLYAGRLDKHKRIDLLVRLTRKLLKSGHHVHLDIVGPDFNHTKKDIELLISELGIGDHVNILGKVSDQDLIELYSEAEVFLSASEYEGFGLTVVEALASGTPCVLNNIPSFEMIADGQNFAKTVDFNNLKEAEIEVKSFLELNDDHYFDASAHARDHALNYSWERVGQKFLSMYSSLIS